MEAGYGAVEGLAVHAAIAGDGDLKALLGHVHYAVGIVGDGIDGGQTAAVVAHPERTCSAE